ncbi:MAG: glycosyltransferase family 4 protein [Polyangiaceae bacterium]
MSEDRILLVAHGHPTVSRGGAEMVAKLLFDEYRARGLDATLLARSSAPSHGGTAFSAGHSLRELSFLTSMSDYFVFRSADARHVFKDFRELLLRLRPTVVHFHHYLHLGIELIHEARRTLPDAKIVLTLHEYLLLCHHQGQMVKTKSYELCYRSAPDDCARCFPERSAADFFLRKRYFEAFLEDVDAFIAPSRFLLERYVEWGIPAERIRFIEYGQPKREPLPPRELAAGETRNRFAYFGQINRFKGVLVLLEAWQRLSAKEKKRIQLEIHGSTLLGHDPAFDEVLRRKLDELDGEVKYFGPYESRELRGLMAEIDWVIVPSTWWENSPVVIEEALGNGRPILCSDIGGMAEKVRDGLDGHHFAVGNAAALATLMAKVSRGNEAWDELRSRMGPPPALAHTADQQLELYRTARS